MIWLLGTALAAGPSTLRPGGAPLLAVRGHLGYPDGMGLDVAVHPVPWFSLEGGIGTLVFVNTWDVRGGPVFDLHRGPRWTLQAAPLFGYRAMHTTAFAIQDTWGGLSAVATADAERWFTDWFALDLQLTVGATWWAWRSDLDYAASFPEVRFALGFAL